MASPSTNTKRLYIGNFDNTTDEYAIVKLFEPFGKITFLDYLFHWSGPRKGQPRGYCFLEYEKSQAALDAINAMHGKTVKGRPLVVSFASTSSEQTDASNQRGQTASARNRPNAFTILKTHRMAHASTDAKIQAIERKLKALKERGTSQPTSAPTNSIRSTMESKAQHSKSTSSQRYKPY